MDQSAIRGSRRSNPATYTGLLEPIRKEFARVNGVKPALFSANSEGACPVCNGAGVIFTELGFLDTVESVCEECEGRRFQAAVLEYKLGDLSIADVLDLSVGAAEAFFAPDGAAASPWGARDLGSPVRRGAGLCQVGPAAHHFVRGRAAALEACRQYGW